MRQVLFNIPFTFFGRFPEGLPIYGFGVMLLIAFLVCPWLAARRAAKYGIKKETIQDLALWLFAGGIVGARVMFILFEGGSFRDFFRIWDGGLVFYGSIIGGVLTYFIVYQVLLKPKGISNWAMADIIAPGVALGLFFGRLGCLLNGCCYGNIACQECPAIHFPLSGAPRFDLVHKGYQTAAGFTMSSSGRDDPRTVANVEPGSPAESIGLRPGDVIVGADDLPIDDYVDLDSYLTLNWPRGKNDIRLRVQRGREEFELGPFTHSTLGLHPTQLYSSLGALLLFFLMMAYDPLKRRDGEVMALLLLAKPMQRFLIEALRNDTPPVAFGLTLSQNLSIIFFSAGLVLAVVLSRRPVQYLRAAR